MQEIKSIDIMSWAKIHALFGIVWGLIEGIIAAIVFPSIGLVHGMIGLTVFGVASIVLFPIIFGIIAFIMGTIMALLYNFFAGKIGGVQVDLAPE